MKNNDMPNFGAELLERTDDYLGKSWRSLTCANIHAMYFGLFNSLKEYKGNSHGFTGYSEYLLFRFFYHQIKEKFGDLNGEPANNSKYAMRFVSSRNRNFWISQGIPTKIGVKRQNPDIAIGRSNQLLGVLQVKIYPVHGIKTLSDEIKKIEELKNQHNELYAAIIIFNKMSDKQKVTVQGLLEGKDWLRVRTLDENHNFLREEMNDCLQLNRLSILIN